MRSTVRRCCSIGGRSVPGAIGRCSGEDKYQYMAVYEFQDEATLERFLESEHFAELRREYDAHFGGVSERARSTYVQVWP